MPNESWVIVVGFLSLTFAVGLWFARRANQNTTEYFLSGRTLPWWIVGTSMVITTFAPDTPLGVSEYVRTGLFNGWFGWNMVMGQILAVFLFARLWRRSGVMTDNELLELRYSGRAAAGLRLFKACHFALLANLVSLSLVISAMVSVVSAATDVPVEYLEHVRWGVVLVALVYCVLAGFWGVVATDFLQFWVAVGGTIAFACVAHADLGGIEAVQNTASAEALSFWPSEPNTQFKILVYMTVMWWGSYNSDGGGYLCQRMLAAKDERHASLGTMWFSLAYAAVRMWPWVVIGSLSLVVFPTIAAHRTAEGDFEVLVNGKAATEVVGTVKVQAADSKSAPFKATEFSKPLPLRVNPDGKVVGPNNAVIKDVGKDSYPMMMKRVLKDHPILLGILMAAFLAAFLSTVDTLVNWGASYMVNDVFRRFVRPEASEKNLVRSAKATVVVILLLAVVCSRYFTSIKDAWIFVWAVSAGLGPVLILRWFWWRINAWSEIAALATSISITASFEICNAIWRPGGYEFAQRTTHIGDMSFVVWQKALIIVGGSIIAATLAVVFGPKTDRERLLSFVRLVRPPGAWGPVRAEAGPESLPDQSAGRIFILWLLGVAVVYGLTFSIGALIYGKQGMLQISLIAAVSGALGLTVLLRAWMSRKEIG